MNLPYRSIVSIIVATLWISISEFVRNEFLLKSYWTQHYASMGIVFPSEPINGAVWGLWSMSFAIAIYIISKRFSWIQTALISWLVGFVMMWQVVGNMGVLPFSILPYAIPLSLLESFVAAYIFHKLNLTPKKEL